MSAKLLRKLGIYVDVDFLPDDLCQAICREIDAGAKTDAAVYSETSKSNDMDRALRSSSYANVSSETSDLITEKIRAAKPVIEAHYSEEYSDELELPKFLIYGPGNYFKPHRDSQLNRKINMTIYLNDEDDEAAPDTYEGGTLKLYEVFKSPAMANNGVSLTGKRGVLVAYPSEIPHEVTPVLRGARYAIVARFLDGCVR